MTYFSQYFKLPVYGHEDLDFVDINLDTDIRLFLDPSLIQGTLTTWCQESQMVLSNFFKNVFNCCKTNNQFDLYRLLSFGHEPNETKLGLSKLKSQGKGTSPDSLINIFMGISKDVLADGKTIVNPMDLCVFIKNFEKDRMSDLITNVLRKQLYEFTVKQCQKYNIPLAKSIEDIGQYWNSNLEMWEPLKVHPLIAKEQNILLVPKNIVRHTYVYSVKHYIYQYIIPIRQVYHLTNLTSLAQFKHTKKNGDHFVKPSKKLVFKKEVKGTKHKDYAQKYSEFDPKSLLDFRDSVMKQIASGRYTLSDEELDYFVYRKTRNVS